jgi:hypothetical protein
VQLNLTNSATFFSPLTRLKYQKFQISVLIWKLPNSFEVIDTHYHGHVAQEERLEMQRKYI